MVDHPSKKAGTENARALLESGERAMRNILIVFDGLEAELRQGNMISDAELRQACLTMAKAQSRLMEEIQKYERHVLRQQGLVQDAPIDFARVRRNIGSRLDRIRKSREAEAVPEQPQS